MLRQVVKMYLQQQNRLSYSSLQCVMTQMQTLDYSSSLNGSRFIGRNCGQKSCFRNIHSTLVHESARKKLKNKSNKINEGDKDNCNDKSHDALIKDENDLDVVSKNVIDKFEDCVTDGKSKLDLGVFMENLSNDDSYSDFDCETFGKELALYEEKDSENLEKRVERSVVPTNLYYKPKSIVQSLLEEEKEPVDVVSSETDVQLAELEEQHNLELVEKGELQVQGVEKVAIPPLTNVAPIVNEFEVLKKLVQLGVDLTVVQKEGMIEHVLKMNFKEDVDAYIWLLKDSGVPSEKVGELITKCPWIFQHDIHNLRVRIDYLRSKKFTKSHIANMLDKDPKFLLIPVDRVDAKLGFLQQEFKLTGKEIREKVGSLSKLIIAKPIIIKESKFYMKKFLGFTEKELKTMFLTYPKIFLYDSDYVANRFDYLHNIMELPHDLIAKTPQALKKSHLKLESRHRFLIKCGRAQYDPTKPNYVSLSALITGRDDSWCFEVAKTSVAEYNQFLRLI